MSISYQSRIAEQQWLDVAVGDDYAKVTYEAFVCNLVKDCGSLKDNLVHMVLGVAGESGELVDAIKKSAIYGKDLDITNIVEELGDLEFYMAGLRQILGLSRSYVLQANMLKLGKRYTSGYSDAAAIARADKVEVDAATHYRKLAEEASAKVPTQQPAARPGLQLVPQHQSNPEEEFPPLSR